LPARNISWLIERDYGEDSKRSDFPIDPKNWLATLCSVIRSVERIELPSTGGRAQGAVDHRG
jgi:hypothetical protein